jgi:hypothetical protein
MNQSAADKIKMMRASLHCFTYGLLALLPFIGIAFGILALIYSGQVRTGQRQFWNPARPYWICGNVSAIFGTLLWSFIFILIVGHVMKLI